MGLLSDYLYAHSGNECPDTFYIWSALTLMGHVVGPKVWYMNGAYKTHLSLYCGLIGSASTAKSTAKNAMKDILVDHFPQFITSANTQSREDIVKLMGADDNCLSWKEKVTGVIHPYHPFFLIANEFQNFMSVNPIGMISFLTDIHGEKHFSDSYKNQGRTAFPNPHMSILSCAVKEWVMSELKLSLLSGGFGRRFILIVADRQGLIPFPDKPLDWKSRFDSALQHLKLIASEGFQGEIIRTPDATSWYQDWYINDWGKNTPEDPILAQFNSSKNVMLIKTACLLSMQDYSFNFTVTADHFERAKFLFESNEPEVKKLSAGIGRNDLAAYGQQIMDTLLRLGGLLQKNKMLLILGRDLKFQEFEEQVNVLRRTQGLIVFGDPPNEYLALPNRYEQLRKEQEAKKAKPNK